MLCALTLNGLSRSSSATQAPEAVEAALKQAPRRDEEDAHHLRTEEQLREDAGALSGTKHRQHFRPPLRVGAFSAISGLSAGHWRVTAWPL